MRAAVFMVLWNYFAHNYVQLMPKKYGKLILLRHYHANFTIHEVGKIQNPVLPWYFRTLGMVAIFYPERVE